MHNEEIYEALRIAHSQIFTDLVDKVKFELTDQQRLALDALNSVLYMAEHEFTEF